MNPLTKQRESEIREHNRNHIPWMKNAVHFNCATCDLLQALSTIDTLRAEIDALKREEK